MAFFDPYDHGDSRQPADFGFFHEHSYDLLEANASMPDPCSDLNDSQLFRDSFSGLHSGSEPLQYPGESEQSAPALESAIVCSDTHIPSASSPNTSDSPLPSSQSQPLKKLDEPDSSCRPRLTPEQTAVLEEYYSHTPRPTTQQKRQHAAKLGLTLEKVNVTRYHRHSGAVTDRVAELVPESASQVQAAKSNPSGVRDHPNP